MMDYPARTNLRRKSKLAAGMVNMFAWVKKWHTIKPGTPKHGTTKQGTPAEQRNTAEQWGNNRTPAEHSGIPTEQQRNTSGTPRNNEMIQNKEKL